jgi:hypothetical protein
MTTSSKTNKPTSLEEVKGEFEKKFLTKVEHSTVSGMFFETFNVIETDKPEELWDFISQQISIAEERGEKRIIKQMEYKFRNAEKNLNQPLTLALIKQAIRELKFELTHKSTKGK